MKFKQLGNGGGLDFTKTNASFLIQLTPTNYLLFDCGFNIMTKLIELDKDPEEAFILEFLTYVCISHLHEDHVGNLSSLLYHRYFMLGGLSTTILAAKQLQPALKHTLHLCTSKLEDGKVVDAKMFELADTLKFKPRTKLGIFIGLRKVHHIVADCYSLFIRHNKTGKALYITGDTKAHPGIEQGVRLLDPSLENTIIFHDFSHWNDPQNNVHACKSEIAEAYSTEFKAKLNYYHSGADFSEEWQEFDNES